LSILLDAVVARYPFRTVLVALKSTMNQDGFWANVWVYVLFNPSSAYDA
jgi:hypothetical protein